MADSCSSSIEDHVILLDALAVLQQIDEEEKKEKLKKRKSLFWLRGVSSSAHFMPDEGN